VRLKLVEPFPHHATVREAPGCGCPMCRRPWRRIRSGLMMCERCGMRYCGRCWHRHFPAEVAFLEVSTQEETDRLTDAHLSKRRREDLAKYLEGRG
jgi:hypothetical protein